MVGPRVRVDGKAPGIVGGGKHEVFGDFGMLPTTVTAPATDAAREWEGWGTALKPAWEPIVLARKPLAASTVAGNVLRYSTGAINVDGCRIGTESTLSKARRIPGVQQFGGLNYRPHHSGALEVMENGSACGRWPANVTLDTCGDGEHDGTGECCASAMLDQQSGERQGTAFRPPVARRRNNGLGLRTDDERFGQSNAPDNYGGSGGASRFFFSSKASRAERNPDQRHAPGEKNLHPTVKPVDLMRWLVRLVTPPEGTVLDPFLGSGSTGIAANREGFNFVGMEMDADYLATARRRIVGESPMFTEVEVA